MAGVLYQVQDINFVDENIGYIAGDVGILYKTVNGGNTWEDKTVLISGTQIESLFSINFLEDNLDIGFACGYHGLLLSTTDAGDSWMLMSSDIPGTNTPNGSNFNNIDFWGNKGLMVAQHGEILEFEYITTDMTAINLEANSVILFPNPVTNILNIADYNEPIDQIQIVDITGKVHLTSKRPIRNSIACQNLSSGQYILRIISKSNITTQLFMKF